MRAYLTKHARRSAPLLVSCALIFTTYFGCAEKREPPLRSDERVKRAPDNVPPAAQVPSVTARWAYEELTDPITGAKQYVAICRSKDRVAFDSPYDEPGGSIFDLVVRNIGEGNDVLLTASKGVFETSISGSQHLRVKFDEGESESWPYDSPEGTSAETIFIADEARFIEHLRNAKQVTIEAPFINAGRRSVEFEVAGFEWKH